MSDWVDKSLAEQQAELERGIALARKTKPTQTQRKHGDVVICAQCLTPIPERRLELYPHSTHCVECLALLEK
ncbi:TraR/DksA C4-type zinc finger protein [Vibrio scophthalmi]|uniref:Zinc finger DksA/TraR C4-type domain-containing protein n=1 Tax=Vibrio scophthalmi TaxID=45658 RepID=A0A1E3WME1_9VIBR|nr:TraR/DksA C4-type zinc finger protein [Vibrio scophthalmi]ODS10940.1 hypothetical protein VSF3289_01201 [Vibrio scophthalmi]